jgi:hypothetical protein
MTFAPPKAPPQPPPAARSSGALLRLGLTVAAVAGLFFLVGLGDLFLVILAVVIMVMVHEAGHFVTAKWSRMKVTEFFVGLGLGCGRSAAARPTTG